ncbi:MULTISPECIES: TIM barrel protein [unclassified Algoriphagus]|jgi:hydroxypyruvate isomerase|uniref:hydroxypyruvate isomerase family protein n=1 Tax=unclassified Algoriphagus TaxID=2641541 RepID=UPI000C4424D3|nr:MULTISPECIES: TIM barrel protein [unclassified Algoriphagus]MAL15992.1 xylose isomerase [Algoriphagus sp.]MAN89054.1 xylose isomerase [Algoriphagus sp.]HAD52895.1 xylose isomerase [Algoriphagus sp.]HAH37736.1 xylose isomerase [Algoriphagus sp.]HCB46963.1 xylose isomerase [Algoriphagus sp.]|tara:strand:- start:8946 stop:9857 length:912 start_codon:yes stop_codon:yes gene_type:complete
MKRRGFIKKLGLGGTVMSVSGALSFPAYSERLEEEPFKMDFAPHFGMFKNSAPGGLADELKFMADQGFRSLEDNGMLGRSIDDQNLIAKTMEQLNMRMGVFVVDGGDNWKTSLTTGKQEFLDNFLNTCKKSVEVAKRVNAKWMTVVPGFYERRMPIGIQTANVIEALKRGAEIFELHGLTMVLEPLSDTPELFLRNADQTYMICKAVGSPSCKILYDIYHMQRNEGNLIATMQNTWDEIAYIQIGDNPGRKEPGTGEIHYGNVFKFIHEKGFDGILGMEHGNAMPGKDGELALIDAYRKVDVQ